LYNLIQKETRLLQKKEYYQLVITIPDTENSNEQFYDILTIKIKILVHLLSYRLNVYYDINSFNKKE
jgi:hypothetical protein